MQVNALTIVNCVFGLATAGTALVGLIRPQAFSHSALIGPGEQMYSRMYAARAVPLGLAAALPPFAWEGAPVATVLGVAAIAQVADVVIGIRNHEFGMTIGAGIAAIVHVACAISIIL